jgi:hypothetical protein
MLERTKSMSVTPMSEAQGNAYIGTKGELVVIENATGRQISLRLHDGINAGGLAIDVNYENVYNSNSPEMTDIRKGRKKIWSDSAWVASS